jgi:N6-L-threonylcarbamoyladenine synthase
MNILSIETSCDETAVSVLKISGDFKTAKYEILGNSLFSQIDIHKEFGGVFPALAKREHIITILPMLEKALSQAKLSTKKLPVSEEKKNEIKSILNREENLGEELLNFNDKHGIPDIDFIAVTCGPGLEPALWVGVNFARALASLWNTKVIPVDHMEGHILASIYEQDALKQIEFPALALLVSGGHTELILIEDWGKYKKVGQTRDDAVGEAFDKVARLLSLPYPGGPQIGKLAAEAREENLPPFAKLPLPMLHSGDLDFSFSGLKTAVLYAINGKELTTSERKSLARDFEEAAIGILIKKSEKAISDLNIASLILGGGVSANRFLRNEIIKLENDNLKVYLPDTSLSTDNSIMIALAGHSRLHEALSPEDFIKNVRANGNQSL